MKTGATTPIIKAKRATALTILMARSLPGEIMGWSYRGYYSVTMKVSVKRSTTPWPSVTSREMI